MFLIGCFLGNGCVQFSRVVWFFAVLGATAVFLYLVVTRLLKLTVEFPKAVNVDVSYGDLLPFPTVTVCNQNFFKYVCRTFKLCLRFKLLECRNCY